MRSFTYIIQDPLGIHARPAGLLVKQAKEYSSTITLKKADKVAQATKLISVMSLGIRTGDEVTICIEGEDEDKIMEEVEIFFKNNF